MKRKAAGIGDGLRRDRFGIHVIAERIAVQCLVRRRNDHPRVEPAAQQDGHPRISPREALCHPPHHLRQLVGVFVERTPLRPIVEAPVRRDRDPSGAVAERRRRRKHAHPAMKRLAAHHALQAAEFDDRGTIELPVDAGLAQDRRHLGREDEAAVRRQAVEQWPRAHPVGDQECFTAGHIQDGEAVRSRRGARTRPAPCSS